MIITDENLLRVECEDVQPGEVEHLCSKLEQELKYSFEMGRPGIGLAGPQIGIAKNIAIIRITNNIGNIFNINLVNCKISKKYDLNTFYGEGCLSFPGILKDTKRYEEIYVVDNLVYPNSFVATGLLSVCIQHELEHLQGKLLIDT